MANRKSAHRKWLRDSSVLNVQVLGADGHPTRPTVTLMVDSVTLLVTGFLVDVCDPLSAAELKAMVGVASKSAPQRVEHGRTARRHSPKRRPEVPE